jgi:RNA polymerase sigma-70 factor, ECF subfamily
MAAAEQHHLAAPASARLYDRHYRRVLSFCLWRLGKREDAEDAAQSTFLNAHNALSRGATPQSEGAWLLAIAANVCRARWRVQQSRPAEVGQEPADLAAVPAPEHDGDLVGALRAALGRLPEQQRRAFALREWRGLSYAEIADELRTTESAVAALVFRARESLTDSLRDERPSRRSFGLDLGSLAAWAKTLLGGTAAKVVVAGAVAGVATMTVAVPLEHAHRSRPATRPAHALAAAAPAVTPATQRRGRTGVTRTRRTIHARTSGRPSATHPIPPRASSPTRAPATQVPSPSPAPSAATGPPPTAPSAPVAPPVTPPAGPSAPTEVVTEVAGVVDQVTGTVTQVTSQVPATRVLPKLGP